ncbi:MAG: hypothetical protein WA775_13010 [Psychroserpens sp.]|uniref:hypothetical protein n=1 Tax=Psychroserpens sp. TaxID=2020870 RepID=UPI003C8A7A85
MTKKDEIEKVHGGGGHVVILGAGASYASSLRNPEKGGKTLPLMRNIIDVVGLNYLVNELPNELKILKEDFEALYSKLVNLGEYKEEITTIDKSVHAYFSELSLPEEPTIYDYLILSLRHRKDIIATFNWDPFLLQAYYRNMEFVQSPGILFLHGCVSLGFDNISGASGPIGYQATQDGQPFEPTKLLYPVDKKDYISDEFINGQWEAIARNLKHAERVSVFGYSAPVSDVEAISLLQKGWGSADDRDMEEFELIDIREEQAVKNSWNTFIHSHHYHYCTDYFDSSFALHPRRTVESHRHRTQPLTPSEAFQDGNPIQDNFETLEELWEWHIPLIEAENKFEEEHKDD